MEGSIRTAALRHALYNSAATIFEAHHSVQFCLTAEVQLELPHVTKTQPQKDPKKNC